MKKTILIVDDDPSINAILNFILQQADYNTIITSSGEDCLKTVKDNHTIDLIFLDLKMSGISGIDTFKKLQKISPNLLVVMMTGHVDESLLKEVFSLGAYGIVYKPFDVEEILTIIKTIFSVPEPSKR